MKKEYDFSKGVRGKFFRADALLDIPIYLDPATLKSLRLLAAKKGLDVTALVNDWLKRDIALIETVLE